MNKHEPKLAFTHDDVLEHIAAELDISTSRFEDAKERYESIGEWLSRKDSSLSCHQPTISPQGSILLGTVIRPLNDEEEYDVDLVCQLSATKSAFTQKGLKEAVGREVALYAKSRNMSNPPKEGRRCWTLTYADGAQFHMDVLPAIPDAEGYRSMLRTQGFGILADDLSLTKDAIAITDYTHQNYDRMSPDWPQSNPKGYAEWFRSRMMEQLAARKRAYAALEKIAASVDEIPDHKVKTPLQRAIQLLKRHRDGMFADDPEHKPISIIITTLAALAYNEEATIAEALSGILKRMHQFIDCSTGVARVENPVNPAENFADKWAEVPKKSENFDEWLKRAQHDFGTYLRGCPSGTLPEEVKQPLGSRLVERGLAAAALAATTADVAQSAPAITQNSDRNENTTRLESAVKEIQREGGGSKPWAKR